MRLDQAPFAGVLIQSSGLALPKPLLKAFDWPAIRSRITVDGVVVRPATAIRAHLRQARGADLVIAEGSMGLFDGVAHRGETGNGASADIAALAGWPVILVLDISGQVQSAAAVALGFVRLCPGLRLAGVILNRAASSRHEALARAGMAEARIPVFGTLPKNGDVTLPERHLGLVQAFESAGLADRLAGLASFAERHLDLDAIRAAAAPDTPRDEAALPARPPLPPPGQRIALAQDAAFSFLYPHQLAGWRAAGAEILPFSPLADTPPPDAANCCWLPGGYPELHAGALSGAARFLTGLRQFADTRPVHGECGGFMVLGQSLTDKDGITHPMAGLLGHATSYASRRMHLGYRAARLLQPMPGLAAGQVLRGHEFHYSTQGTHPNGSADQPLSEIRDANDSPLPEGGGFRRMAGGGSVSGNGGHPVDPPPDGAPRAIRDRRRCDRRSARGAELGGAGRSGGDHSGLYGKAHLRCPRHRPDRRGPARRNARAAGRRCLAPRSAPDARQAGGA
ncbi:cobyrinate a,c-diamide synthase [Tabrizicola sp. DMG-N-6]|uniref:Cobyrinate a,c-diamide synthase n=1 Tax=Szabonella alba TaxID=2804194 RepID=A0A8K0VDQ8_9RHOB|nr:cobyrinate a,c-diamide synthase [Szabonella alba]